MALPSASAQTPIPNGDFESWSPAGSGLYEEPTGGWWTSLNALKSLGAPVTVEKSTDAHGGSYSAKLTSKQWGTILLPGLLVSGRFDVLNPQFLVQGQPFADKPDAFQGWYKYTGVNGDSAGIATLLTVWNAGAGRRDTVAAAGIVVTSSQSSWTYFDIPFFYSLNVIPDSITVALVSSGDGANFNGQVGSTLWVDDLHLDYATAAPAPLAPASSPVVRLRGQALDVSLPTGTGTRDLRLRDIDGRLLHAQTVRAGSQTIDLDLPSGIYLVEIAGVHTPAFHQKIALIRP
jgi:Putative carbohydrate metabolism domain